MTWKRIVSDMIAIIILVTCAGCQQTPKEVQDEIDYKKQVSSQIDQKADAVSEAGDDTNTVPEIQFDTIAHIFSTAEEVMAQPYENLRFRKKLELVKPDCCGKLKFQVVQGFDQEYKTLFPKYIGNDYDDKYISYRSNIVPKGPDYEGYRDGKAGKCWGKWFFCV